MRDRELWRSWQRQVLGTLGCTVNAESSWVCNCPFPGRLVSLFSFPPVRWRWLLPFQPGERRSCRGREKGTGGFPEGQGREEAPPLAALERRFAQASQHQELCQWVQGSLEDVCLPETTSSTTLPAKKELLGLLSDSGVTELQKSAQESSQDQDAEVSVWGSLPVMLEGCSLWCLGDCVGPGG